MLRHLADAGFVVAAANTTQSNADKGQNVLDGVRALIAANDDAASVYHGKIDTARIATIGHSQGGAAAINAGADPLVTAVLALEPGPNTGQDRIHTPTLYLAGEDDDIVRPAWVRNQYDRSDHVPTWFAELGGAGHLGIGKEDNGFRPTITNWLKYTLYNDETATAIFTGPEWTLETDPAFTETARNAKARDLN
ncbi:poly(ethylene terephthalate) hydrolase family protein [Nocardia rhizosphaerae]|uniref:PET hydrolase/cutinase-like domain-containing protein n=1 Tax=Nocardia rhizosphaerae TaxID=1691571 RepID=A0ABV8LCH8_9NOCA